MQMSGCAPVDPGIARDMNTAPPMTTGTVTASGMRTEVGYAPMELITGVLHPAAMDLPAMPEDMAITEGAAVVHITDKEVWYMEKLCGRNRM